MNHCMINMNYIIVFLLLEYILQSRFISNSRHKFYHPMRVIISSITTNVKNGNFERASPFKSERDREGERVLIPRKKVAKVGSYLQIYIFQKTYHSSLYWLCVAKRKRVWFVESANGGRMEESVFEMVSEISGLKLVCLKEHFRKL